MKNKKNIKKFTYDPRDVVVDVSWAFSARSSSYNPVSVSSIIRYSVVVGETLVVTWRPGVGIGRSSLWKLDELRQWHL
jgi:hypothetical protein